MHEFCGDDKRYHRFEVDDEEELDRKRILLSTMLEGDGCIDGEEDLLYIKHIEKVLTGKTEMTCDPTVTNKESDPRYVYFLLNVVDQTLRATFITQINTEFGIRGWPNAHGDGSLMTIKKKVAKLKTSLMKGRMIRVMKDSIKSTEDK